MLLRTEKPLQVATFKGEAVKQRVPALTKLWHQAPKVDQGPITPSPLASFLVLKVTPPIKKSPVNCEAFLVEPDTESSHSSSQIL